MKKAIISLVLAGVMIGMVSCGNKEKEDDISKIDPQIDASVTTDAAQEEKGSFKELPDEANGAFNTVINAAKNAYPVSAGFARQYGYKGTEQVNGEDCYLFSVYDFADDSRSIKVGEFAKAVGSESVYCMADGSKDFEPLTLADKTVPLSFSGNSSNDLKSAVKLAAQTLQEK